MVSYQMHVILIISLFWTTSEQTRFVTYFSEENLSCLLEHRHLKQNETSVLEKLPLSTLTDCIVACYLRNRNGFCNEIYFSKSKLICYFIEQQEDPFEDTDEEHRYLYYFIHKCAFVSIEVISIEIIKGTNFNFECSTEIIPEQRGIISEDFESQPFSSRGSEWMEYIASFGSRRAFLTANLYEFYEICKIKEVDPKSVKNLILHKSYPRVNSLNTCLHKCRRAISEWPYRAVHYSPEKKYCHIYVKSNGTSVNVILEADEQFVELQTCFTDRRYDRANNPDALVFYIQSQGEVCLVEFYRKVFLNHWKTINYIMNATNIIECLSWCRHYDNRDECSAINFAVDGKCRLLKKLYRRVSYRTLRKSVFGEVLVCKPGCLTDEFQPF
ncbi:hypothetical protein T09_6981 [Trichinella sp. T9]|nr:hypothetical protein T09_6981 [Trichinella sp. T9]